MRGARQFVRRVLRILGDLLGVLHAHTGMVNSHLSAICTALGNLLACLRRIARETAPFAVICTVVLRARTVHAVLRGFGRQTARITAFVNLHGASSAPQNAY